MPTQHSALSTLTDYPLFIPQEKFGVDVIDSDGKIGTRRLSDYGSSVDTDDLANDSDLDVTTRK